MRKYLLVLIVLSVCIWGCNNKEGTIESTIDKEIEVSTDSLTSTAKETDESSKATLPEVTSEKQTQTDPQTVTVVEPAKDEPMPYYIKVNRAFNCITVYIKDDKGEYAIPYKAFACSVGDYDPTNPNSEPTPLGTFNLSDKYEWGLMVDGSYGRYAYRICTDILFHSVPYLGRVKDGLETDQYNKLGEEASLGCVRLNVRDAKWIFENCPKGTYVEIYDDETTPGPLGKPDTIKIPEDSPYAGWDPMEEDENNPWNNFSATITGAKDITISKGGKIDIYAGVIALDKCGNDITERMIVTGEFDTSKLGEYNVTYSVTDATGSTAREEIKIIVK